MRIICVTMHLRKPKGGYSLKNRIAAVIADAKITKAEFAKRIEVSQPFVSQMCSGAANPSARTITNICREFHIRREWLENGEGPMRLPEPDIDTDIINDLLADTDDPVAAGIKAIYKVYKELPDEDQEVLRRFIKSILDSRK